MNLLFDASSFLNLIRILGEGAINYLRGNYVLTLTSYEVGNALWKEATLLGTIGINEALALLEYVNKVYEVMYKIMPRNALLVMKLAHAVRITYYDAAYVIASYENNLALVTDDIKLQQKIKSSKEIVTKILQREVEIITTEDLLKQQTPKEGKRPCGIT